MKNVKNKNGCSGEKLKDEILEDLDDGKEKTEMDDKCDKGAKIVPSTDEDNLKNEKD